VFASKHREATQVTRWKRQAIDGLTGVLSDKVKKAENNEFEVKELQPGVVAGIGVGLITEHFVTSLDFPDAALIQRCPAAQV